MIRTMQMLEATVLRWGKTETAGHFGDSLDSCEDLLYVTCWVTDDDELAVMIGDSITHMHPGDEIVVVEDMAYVRENS